MVTTLITPGDLCCMPILGSVGKLIEFGQWLDGDKFQPYEHVVVYLGHPLSLPQTEWGYTASAYPDRHGIRPLACAPTKVQGALWSSGAFKLSDYQRVSIVRWCLSHPNVAYGNWDYPQLFLHHFGINSKHLRRKIESDNSLICSAYADASYRAAGYQMFDDGRWENDVVPMDIAQLIEERLGGQAR